MFQRSWVQIQAPYTDGHFSHLIVVKFVWRDENKWKEAGEGPFKKTCRGLPCDIGILLDFIFISFQARSFAEEL